MALKAGCDMLLIATACLSEMAKWPQPQAN